MHAKGLSETLFYLVNNRTYFFELDTITLKVEGLGGEKIWSV